MKKALVVGSALAAAVAAGSALWWLGGQLTNPVPSEIGPPPDDFPVEPVDIPGTRGHRLRGWFLPAAEAQGAVLLLHGIWGNRNQMLSRARFLHAAGYAVLLMDLRGHGESEGKRITCGHLESSDAEFALRWLKARLPGQPVAVHGFSLGGLAALLPDPPLEVDAYVLEAVTPDLVVSARQGLRTKFGRLADVLVPLLFLQFPLRIGVWAKDLAPLDQLSRLDRPKLVIAGRKDIQTTMFDTELLWQTAIEPKELWVIEDAEHTTYHEAGGAEYERRVLEFLERSIGRPRTGP